MLTSPEALIAPPGFAEQQAGLDTSPGLEALILAGLPRDSLRRVAARIGGDAEAASAIEYSVVPKSTLARRTGRLTVEESERVERLARLFTHAAVTLGTEDEARGFLLTPHPLLERRQPIEVGLTDLGARRVEGLLHALEYGLPA